MTDQEAINLYELEKQRAIERGNRRVLNPPANDPLVDVAKIAFERDRAERAANYRKLPGHIPD